MLSTPLLKTGWISGQLAVINPSLDNNLQPLLLWLIGLASLVCAGFIVMAGIEYMTAQNNALTLQKAKQTLKNACLGLILVLMAGFLVNFLTKSYQLQPDTIISQAPLGVELSQPDVSDQSAHIIQITTEILHYLVASFSQPILNLIEYLSQQTPQLSSQPMVAKLWLVVLGMANSLLVLVIILLGFKMMSETTLGLEGLSFKAILVRLALIFLVMNSSLLLIESLIILSNHLLDGLWTSFDSVNPWLTWKTLSQGGILPSLAGSLLLIIFVSLAVFLAIYYFMRLVIIYLGAILSPLICLLLFFNFTKGFALSSFKTYLFNLFVLFIHNLILILSTSLIISFSYHKDHFNLISLMIGIGSLILMIKIPKTIARLSNVNYGFKAISQYSRQLTTQVNEAFNQIRLKQLSLNYKAEHNL
ncbi:MAG: hypothetical protein OXF85_01445 [Candidatus Saccharibacteria bacterium]|nr:hypothetical protein [Candidatus Saccharibacteria bacterium]